MHTSIQATVAWSSLSKVQEKSPLGPWLVMVVELVRLQFVPSGKVVLGMVGSSWWVVGIVAIYVSSLQSLERFFCFRL